MKAGLINEKRVHRLYREMSLQLRAKSPKRRVKAKLRDDRQAATGSNEVWAMDFVHDRTALGTKISQDSPSEWRREGSQVRAV